MRHAPSRPVAVRRKSMGLGTSSSAGSPKGGMPLVGAHVQHCIVGEEPELAPDREPAPMPARPAGVGDETVALEPQRMLSSIISIGMLDWLAPTWATPSWPS